MQERFWVIVPAAGRGLRLGGALPKQYLDLAGRPLLQHTLARLLGHPRIDGVVLALAAGDPFWPALAASADPRVRTCSGGAARMDSVLAGLQALPDAVGPADFVLVHDAARPLLAPAELDRLFAALDDGAEGALLALPLSDSLKRADDHGRVAASVPREGLWRALTPQAFRRAALLAALQSARAAGVEVTDEAQAMERVGVAARLVPGAPLNFKVTTAADLELAALCLARGSGG